MNFCPLLEKSGIRGLEAKLELEPQGAQFLPSAEEFTTLPDVRNQTVAAS